MPKTKTHQTKKTVSSQNTSFQAYMSMFEDTLNTYFGKKAPALPKGVKEFLVSIAPWLTVVSVVLTLPALFALVGLSLAGSMLSVRYSMYGFWGHLSPMISGVFSLILFVLNLLAISGLFKRKKEGWNYVFYGSLVSAVYSLLTLNVFGLVVGTLLSMYFLFQVRPYYK